MPAAGFSTSYSPPTLPGVATDWSPSYGGRPRVPNPIASQTAALTGNIGNLASIYNLAGGIDTAGINTLSTATQAAVPGLTQRLHGELPDDVINQILRQSAERGISSGTGFRGADYLKALGLTSLGVATGAAGELESAIGRAPLVNPNNLLVTPEQQQEAGMAANLYASAPVPAYAAGASLGAAQSGVRAGMGAVPTFSGAGSYDPTPRDALGFPIDTSWSSANYTNPPAVGAANPQEPAASSFSWEDYLKSIGQNQNQFGSGYSPDQGYLSGIGEE